MLAYDDHESSDTATGMVRLAELFSVTPDYAFSADAQGTIQWANPALEQLVGEPLAGKSVLLFRPEWVRELLEREARPAALRDGHWVGYTAIAPPGGAEMPVRQVLVVHYDARGDVTGYSAVLHDLSAREEMAERFRVLTDTLPAGVFHNAPDGSCVWVNASYCMLTGLTHEQAKGFGWLSSLEPESRDLLTRAATGLAARGSFGPEVVAFRRPDGERREANLKVALIRARDGTVQGQVGVLTDVTARRAEQRALAESEQRFRTVLAAMDEGVVLHDASGAVRLWNPAAERILGLSPEQLMGVTPLDPRWKATDEQGRALPGEQHPAMLTLRSGQSVLGFVMGVDRPGADHLWIRVNCQPTTLPGGGRGVVATFADITNEREASLLLRSSERQLRVVTNAAREALCLHEADGSFAWLSEGAVEVLGWHPEELLGLNPYAFFHPDDIERIRREAHERALRGEEANDITYRFRRRDGRYVWVDTQTAVVAATESAPMRLVTNTRSAESRMASTARQSVRERLGGLSAFAGRLAHDLTNLNSVVQNRLEMVLEGLDHELREDVEAAFEATRRATELTNALRALSGTEPVRPVKVDVRVTLTSLMDDIRQHLDETTALSVSMSSAPLHARVDLRVLAFALAEVVRNAVEAMPGGGRIAITCEEVTLHAPHVDPHGDVPPGRYVAIRCTDSGPGIDPTLLPRLFEPELSRKGSQLETGLGLPLTLARMERMGAHVSVRNAANGGGTEVSFWLPLIAREAPAGDDLESAAATAPEAASHRATTSETPEPAARDTSRLPAPAAIANESVHVLVVDDDAMVLKTAVRLLSRSGFQVTSAGSGFEALSMLADAGARVDVLVSDVMMPGMSGPQLVRALRERGDQRPVVFISGYTGDSLPESEQPEAQAPLVSKPFTVAVLTEAIHQVLRAAAIRQR